MCASIEIPVVYVLFLSQTVGESCYYGIESPLQCIGNLKHNVIFAARVLEINHNTVVLCKLTIK